LLPADNPAGEDASVERAVRFAAQTQVRSPSQTREAFNETRAVRVPEPKKELTRQRMESVSEETRASLARSQLRE